MSDTGKIIALAKAVGARPDPDDVKQNVEDWLDDHPEATTTVQDGAITRAKLAGDLEKDIAVAEDRIYKLGQGKSEKLKPMALAYGNFALDDDVSSPSATDYRMVYPQLMDMGDDDVFIFSSNGVYNVAFGGFDADGVCVKAPPSWLSDGTYTLAQIKANVNYSSAVAYSFQIKRQDNGKISPTVVRSTQYASIQSNTVVYLPDNSVEESKLSPEVRAKLNGGEGDTNLLADTYLVQKAYKVGDDIDSPTEGGDARKAYAEGFEVTGDTVFTAATNGAFNIAFAAFDADGKCITTPNAWLTDGVYDGAAIMANARTTGAAKYSFQIRKTNNGNFGQEIKVRDYYSLEKMAITPTVDVVIFMGQSNMAGRGEAANAPTIENGAGFEYLAISAPNTVKIMAEPFGATEAKTGGIDEGSAKTGSMAVAFSNAYHRHNGNVSVIGISAAKGGTPISDWQPEGAYLTDAMNRFSSCVSWLTTNGYTIRHKYVLWCQGETDGDNSTTAEGYKALFDTMLAELKENGIEKLFMVRIGNYNSEASTKYDTIMNCQTQIAQTEPDVVMVSTDFAGMRARELMKDAWHYYQAAYNEVGEYAGINAAIYASTGKEPTMYDTQDGSLYFSHKN